MLPEDSGRTTCISEVTGKCSSQQKRGRFHTNQGCPVWYEALASSSLCDLCHLSWETPPSRGPAGAWWGSLARLLEALWKHRIAVGNLLGPHRRRNARAGRTIPASVPPFFVLRGWILPGQPSCACVTPSDRHVSGSLEPVLVLEPRSEGLHWRSNLVGLVILPAGSLQGAVSGVLSPVRRHVPVGVCVTGPWPGPLRARASTCRWRVVSSPGTCQPESLLPSGSRRPGELPSRMTSFPE